MYKYFKLKEFMCKETKALDMDYDFIHKLDELREACGFAFTITSGYRDVGHSIEAAKIEKGGKGGTHTQGIAADIAVRNGAERYVIVREAMRLGFTGIGVAKTFVHVDVRKTDPVVWSY